MGVASDPLFRLALLDPAFEQLDPFRGPGPVARHGAILDLLGVLLRAMVGVIRGDELI
jgi:hypothetical protein